MPEIIPNYRLKCQGGFSDLFLLVLFFVTFSGCGAYVLDEAQNDLRKNYLNGELQRSADLLKRFDEKDVYRSKDNVLYHLEYGTVLHFTGAFDSSSTMFSIAEEEIDNLYTKSISRGLGSLLVNDNVLAYDGEPYEDIYLNIFKSLNFMHLKDYEAALVENRRLAFKMEQLDIRLKGLAEAFAKRDSMDVAEWNPDDVNIQNSALGHYLSAILYAKSLQPDDARIEFTKLKTALREQAPIRKYRPPSPSSMPSLTNPNAYNVLLVAFTGVGPTKRQEDVRLFFDEGYVKFSFPVLEVHDTRIASIRIRQDAQTLTELDMIEEMDAVAAEIYKAKQPIIYGRAMLRGILKAAGTAKARKEAKEKSDGLGFLTGLAGLIGKEITEKADLRGWQTMPGQAWTQVLKLPAGDHTLSIQYLSTSGRILHEEARQLNISPDTELEILEFLNPN